MAAFQTDSLNPTHLTSGVLGRRRPGATGGASSTRAGLFDSGAPTISARDRFAADWNTRIDKEVRAVVDGLGELVDLADIGVHPAPHQAPPQALHLRLRTAQLVRAAQALRDTAHELRLMLVLSNELDMAQRRDAEVRAVRDEVTRGREAVGRGVRGLFVDGNAAEAEAEGEDAEEGQVDGGHEVDGGADEDAETARRGEGRVEPRDAGIEQAGSDERLGGNGEGSPKGTSAVPASVPHIPTAAHDEDEDSDDFEEV